MYRLTKWQKEDIEELRKKDLKCQITGRKIHKVIVHNNLHFGGICWDGTDNGEPEHRWYFQCPSFGGHRSKAYCIEGFCRNKPIVFRKESKWS